MVDPLVYPLIVPTGYRVPEITTSPAKTVTPFEEFPRVFLEPDTYKNTSLPTDVVKKDKELTAPEVPDIDVESTIISLEELPEAPEATIIDVTI